MKMIEPLSNGFVECHWKSHLTFFLVKDSSLNWFSVWNLRHRWILDSLKWFEWVIVFLSHIIGLGKVDPLPICFHFNGGCNFFSQVSKIASNNNFILPSASFLLAQIQCKPKNLITILCKLLRVWKSILLILHC